MDQSIGREACQSGTHFDPHAGVLCLAVHDVHLRQETCCNCSKKLNDWKVVTFTPMCFDSRLRAGRESVAGQDHMDAMLSGSRFGYLIC